MKLYTVSRAIILFYRAEVSFIILDDKSIAPLSVDEVLQLLQATNTSDKLKDQGFDIVNIEAVVPPTSKEISDTENEPRVNIGAILGGVFGSILIVIIVIAIIVVLAMMIRKRNTG